MNKIVVKETELREALRVFPKIVEFDRKEAGTVEYCENKIGNNKNLILTAYVNDDIAGYLIAYEKNNSFYCWCVAVSLQYRRLGILTSMMQKYEDFARTNKISKLTIKTVNDKRQMLSYLVKNNWNFTEVIENSEVIKNEIRLEKIILL